MRWNGIAVINKPVSALPCDSTVCCQGCRSSDFQRAKVSCSKSLRLSCPQQSKQPIPTGSGTRSQDIGNPSHDTGTPAQVCSKQVTRTGEQDRNLTMSKKSSA